MMSWYGRVGQENGTIFEALRTMSACYLRADTAAICACIQAFALNDLLFSIARLERLFNKRSCNGAPPPPHGLVADVLGAALDGRLQSQHACMMASRRLYCRCALLALHAGSECLHLRLFGKRASKGALSHGG